MIDQLKVLYKDVSCEAEAGKFVELLDKFDDFGSPIDVVHLIEYVFSSYTVIAQKAAKIIRILLAKKEAENVFLKLHRYCGDYLFSGKNIKEFEQFMPVDAVHLYGMASLDADGYLREEALDCLRHLHIAEALPYILLRLNDWVPQIQDKARKALLEIFPLVSISDIIKHYKLIEWLGKTTRIMLADVQKEFFKKLSSPENRTELLLKMKMLSCKEKLFCCKALGYELANDNLLLEIVMTEPMAEIKQWIIYHLANTVSLKSKFETLFSDRSIRVRYAILKSMSNYSFEEYRRFFEAAIFDNSSLVRAYARYMLYSHGINNQADLYRKKLAQRQEQVTIGVVAGMAETSEKRDVPLIKTFANDRHAEIRAAVLVALNRLNAKDADELYIQGIQDSNSKVRKVCVSILRSGYSHLRPRLEDLFENGDVMSQISVLRVLTHYYRVLERLKSILMALMQPSEKLQLVAWQYFFSWHEKHQSRLLFYFEDETYNQTLNLMNELIRRNIDPPVYVRMAWHDLPNMLKVLRAYKNT